MTREPLKPQAQQNDRSDFDWQTGMPAPLFGPATQDASAPLLVDPFLGRKEPAPKRAPFAPAALAAALLSILPIGSLAAIFVGISGLRQTKLGTLRGRNVAIAAIAVGSLCTLGYATAAVGLSIHYIDEARADERHEQAKWERKRKEREEESKVPVPERPRAPEREPPPVPANGTVPQKTEERLIGTIPVVDIGVSEASLSQALLKQAALAKAEGRDVMVNVMSASCVPCVDQFKTLSDPLMQAALAKTRFVRVSIDVFKDDLLKLQMRVAPLPWFFLLRPDGTPRDGINGGEWGEDVAANIAPILGPFARGELKRRKQPFEPGKPHGTFL